MVFQWSLRDRKSPQVFRTFLSILADLNNAAVWMVWARSLIFNSSSSLTKRLWGFYFKCSGYKWYHRHLNSPLIFVLSQGLSTFLSFRFLWCSLCRLLWHQNPLFGRFSFFFFFCKLSFSLIVLAGLGDKFISQNPGELCTSPGRILVCAPTIW